MIPDGWEVGKIKDLIKSLDAGVSVNSENKSIQNGEIGVLKVSAVSYGKFLPSEHKVALTEEIHRLTIYPKKDRILISRANTPDLVGASVYIDRDYPNLFLPDKLWQTEPRHNDFSIRWLSYLISSDDYRLKISSHATGTSMSMKNISKVDLLNIEIIIPPLLEQCRIAEVLGVWDESIDLLEKLIGKTRSRKQGLMQQLLTGKKRFKEFEGSEWKKVSIGEIAFVDKRSLNNSTPKNYTFFYISLSDLDNGHISNNLEQLCFEKAPSRARRLVSNNDILLATVRPNLKSFAIVKTDADKYVVSTGFAVITVKKDYCADYLYQYIFSNHIEKQIEALVTGSNYPAINSTEIKNLSVYCPSLPEQEKIAAVLSAADEEISTLEKQLAAYKQQKLGLMQQLLTGKIRVGMI